MILDKNSDKLLYIPRNSIIGMCNEEKYKLVLHCDSTNEKYEFYVEDQQNFYDYYTFELDLSNVVSGEYEYHLYTYGVLKKKEILHDCISSGIVKIKDNPKIEKEYKDNTIIKKYYK